MIAAQIGTLPAPVGYVTACQMHVKGAVDAQMEPSISAHVAEALALVMEVALAKVHAVGAYVLRCEPHSGTLEAVFLDPESAILWALHTQQELAQGSWPGELLEHPVRPSPPTVARVEEAPHRGGVRARSPGGGAVKAFLLCVPYLAPQLFEEVHRWDADRGVLVLEHRGPRLSFGVHAGVMDAAVVCTTGRLLYKGKVGRARP